ncbi:MAG: hypothetical protein JW863_21925 [Chitinispirillaceae bacterium]|nr:hypothetical protein [Chitinispirillaceae bacterium]
MPEKTDETGTQRKMGSKIILGNRNYPILSKQFMVVVLYYADRVVY